MSYFFQTKKEGKVIKVYPVAGQTITTSDGKTESVDTGKCVSCSRSIRTFYPEGSIFYSRGLSISTVSTESGTSVWSEELIFDKTIINTVIMAAIAHQTQPLLFDEPPPELLFPWQLLVLLAILVTEPSSFTLYPELVPIIHAIYGSI